MDKDLGAKLSTGMRGVPINSKFVFCLFALVFVASSGGHLDSHDGKIYYLITEGIVHDNSLKIRLDQPSADRLDLDLITIVLQQYENQFLDSSTHSTSICASEWARHVRYCNSYDPQADVSPADLPWQSFYTASPPLLPIIGAPFYALEQHVGFHAQIVPWLVNPLILAATATVLFRLSHAIFNSRSRSLVLSVAFGICSFVWPYGDTFFLQPLAGLLLVLAVYLAYINIGRDSTALSLVAGISAVSVIFAHAGSIIFVPGLLAFSILSNLHHRKKSTHSAWGLPRWSGFRPP